MITVETLSIPKSKKEKIKQSCRETRKRHSLMTCTTIDTKIVDDSLSQKQKDVLSSLFLEAKWFYNDMISFIESDNISSYDTTKKHVSVRMGKNNDSYDERKLVSLSASMKQKMKSNIQSSLKSLAELKRNGHKVGKIDYTKSVKSIPLKQYRKDFSILSPTSLSIAKVGKVRVRGLHQIPQGADISNATLLHLPDGYHIHITIYTPYSIDVDMNLPVCGLDFGIKESITTSDGETFHAVYEITSRIKGLQRKLSRQHKGSNNYCKTLDKIRREYQKIDNLKKEHAYKIARYLLDNYSVIIMQDENISGWHKGLFGKQVQYGILGRIKKILVHSDQVAMLNRFVPTTQYCPECGRLNKHSLEKRTYHCMCGYSYDRDIHAAKNMIELFNKGNDSLVKKYSPVERGSTPVEHDTSSD